MVRKCAAVALLAISLGIVLWPHGDTKPAPDSPARKPFKGLFVGETASQDAVLLSCLTASIAEYLEWDKSLDTPKITHGVQIEQLRTAAREARCHGASIGQRQPKVRDAIKDFLDRNAGTNAGKLSDADKVAWIKAFRDVSQYCKDAAQ